MSQSVGLTRNYNTGKVLSSFPLSVVLRHPVFPTISPGFSEFCAILKQGRGLNVPLFLSLSGADLLLWTIPSPTPPRTIDRIKCSLCGACTCRRCPPIPFLATPHSQNKSAHGKAFNQAEFLHLSLLFLNKIFLEILPYFKRMIQKSVCVCVCVCVCGVCVYRWETGRISIYKCRKETVFQDVFGFFNQNKFTI